MTGQAWLAGAALALAAGSAQANDTARVEAQAADAYPCLLYTSDAADE